MGWTTCSSADPIHVLIALGGVLGKIDASAKHSSDVCVTLIKALMDDCVDEGRTVKEHALVVVVVILICNFLLSVCVSFPQLLIHNLLNLNDVVPAEDPACVASVAVLSDRAL